MALAVTGRLDEASLAYDWLLQMQRPGRQLAQLLHRRPRELLDRLDDRRRGRQARHQRVRLHRNGRGHHWLITQDRDFVERLWPAVRRAIDWVLSMQTERGEVVWARGRGAAGSTAPADRFVLHPPRTRVRARPGIDRRRRAPARWELALAALGALSARQGPLPASRTAGPWTGTTRCSATSSKVSPPSGVALGVADLRDAGPGGALRERRAL